MSWTWAITRWLDPHKYVLPKQGIDVCEIENGARKAAHTIWTEEREVDLGVRYIGTILVFSISQSLQVGEIP